MATKNASLHTLRTIKQAKNYCACFLRYSAQLVKLTESPELMTDSKTKLLAKSVDKPMLLSFNEAQTNMNNDDIEHEIKGFLRT